jgi:hypothetical protein
MSRSCRTFLPVVSALLLGLLVAAPAEAQPPNPTLVLPLRSVGVSDTTILVSRDLLEGSLQDLGVRTISASSLAAPLPFGPGACDDPDCAGALGREHDASQVVYGSMSRLGDKVVARINVLRVGEAQPFYRDQLTATTEEDLDRVMRRFAEGIAVGRPNSDRASVESVTQDEARRPARRAVRRGLGFRAGFLFPTGDSYGGQQRLTNLHLAYKYEARTFQIESTSILGFSWKQDTIDWTILDVAASRILGTGDLAPYLGAGVGVHSVHVQREFREWREFQGTAYEVWETKDQSETVPSVDLVAGLLAFRTYDFEIIVEVRYHYIFEDFQKVDGNGAQGFRVTFGTSR